MRTNIVLGLKKTTHSADSPSKDLSRGRTCADFKFSTEFYQLDLDRPIVGKLNKISLSSSGAPSYDGALLFFWSS